MSADKSRILADVVELLTSISDSLPPGVDITSGTRLSEDLGLADPGLASLSGRVQARYGSAANLVPFFAKREQGTARDLRVGELVDHIARVLDEAQAGPAADKTTELVTSLVEQVAGRAPAPGHTFAEDGFTMSDLLRVTSALEARFGAQSRALLLDKPTVAGLAGYLDQQYGPDRAAQLLASAPDERASGDLGGGFAASAAGHRARNDNEAVLRELAPGASRTLVRLPQGQVEVFTAGSGQPLVLMHPINVGAGVFARQFTELAAKYRVICIHRPGVGATTWDADVSLSGLARLQRTVLAELAVSPPFHVLGSSFGGLVAQQFVLLYPKECASLTLAGCSYRAGARPGVRRFPAVLQGEFEAIACGGGDQTMAGGRAELEEILLRCESMDTRIGFLYAEAFSSRPSLQPRLPDITTPALILRGRHDTMVPAEHADVLTEGIRDARFTELPDAGHFPGLTHPGQLHELLVPFIDAHPEVKRATLTYGVSRLGAVVRDRVNGNGQVAGPLVVPPPPDPCSVIISTGRCGSTLLSALVADEPGTMSASETLAMVRSPLLLMPLTELTGSQYWKLLSEPSEQGSIMNRIGIMPSEYRYPDNGRFAADKASIPPILYVMLPGISPDPDLLFGILDEKVPQFPAQTAGQHHKMLLDLLANLTSKRRWIERSGASSMVAEPVLRAFPEAKFVYLTRNIEDTALSMSKHASFQFAAARHEFHVRYGADPYTRFYRREKMPDPAELPPDLRRLLPDELTAETLQEMGQDLSRFVGMCAHMMGQAEQALAEVKPKHLYRIRYEDMVARPLDELTGLGEFFEFEDPAGWAANVADRVRPSRSRKAAPAPA